MLALQEIESRVGLWPLLRMEKLLVGQEGQASAQVLVSIATFMSGRLGCHVVQ